MRILVTGGSGFIGGAIVKELESGNYIADGDSIDIFDLRAPTFSTGARFVKKDVTENMSGLLPYDIVFHCAGLLGSSVLFEQVREAVATNVLGAVSILQLQKDTGIIFQLGLLGNWLNPYMISKRTGERCGLMYRKWYGTRFVSVRCTDVYGPRQSLQQAKVTPTFVMRALANEPIPIYGDGTYHVQLVYVDDVARLLVAAALEDLMVEPTIDISSLQSENTIAVLDYAKRIIDMTSSKSTLEFLPMRIGQPVASSEAEVQPNVSQTRKLFDQLSFVETPLELGLERTIAWCKDIFAKGGM